MFGNRKKELFTPDEYLGQEEAAKYKSEYYQGEIFAMVGGTADHSIISLNVGAELRARLRGGPCTVLTSDVKLHVKANGLYTYPDLMVVCGKIEFLASRRDVVVNPVIVFEVLSESTRSYDRGAKYGLYKELPSLQEYVLVDAEQPHVECFRRNDLNQWMVEFYDGMEARAQFPSIGVELPLEEIYLNVSWAQR